MSTEVEQRPGEPRQVGRRAVARGAAWSIPVVSLAVAAPAMAASGCTMTAGQLNWSTVALGNQLNKALATTGGTGVTVTVTVSGATTATGNGVVTNTATGGLHPVMRFTSVNGAPNTQQVITLTFNKPIQNVSFSLLDIDSSPGGYYDQVIIGTTGWTGSKGSNVIGGGVSNGNGNNTGPYRPPDDDSPVDGSDGAGNLGLSWAGPLSSVSFTYRQNGTMTGSPFIGISNISFQYCL